MRHNERNETFGTWSKRIKLDLLEKHVNQWGSWRREVRVRSTGKLYRVGVTRGSAARGMYGVKGFHWYGWVVDVETDAQLHNARCEKGTGARGLIGWAWLYEDESAISIPELTDVPIPCDLYNPPSHR